jgi:hypothetical protein
MFWQFKYYFVCSKWSAKTSCLNQNFSSWNSLQWVIDMDVLCAIPINFKLLPSLLKGCKHRLLPILLLTAAAHCIAYWVPFCTTTHNHGCTFVEQWTEFPRVIVVPAEPSRRLAVPMGKGKTRPSTILISPNFKPPNLTQLITFGRPATTPSCSSWWKYVLLKLKKLFS